MPNIRKGVLADGAADVIGALLGMPGSSLESKPTFIIRFDCV